MEWVALLRWLIVLGGLWLAGLPLAKAVFGRFRYSGAAFGIPVALAVLSLGTYWIGKLHFRAGVVVSGIGLLLAAGVATYRLGLPTRSEVGPPITVFALAFVALLAVRVADPAITPQGGEQFLDFSVLKAIVHSGALLPEDPWFAGEPVRYYYGGYLTGAIVTVLADVSPRIAYNLLLPTFYASLVTGIYGLAASIAARRGRPAPLSGAIAALVAAASGTLATPARLLVTVLPRSIGEVVARPVFGGIRGVSVEEMLTTATSDPTWWSYWNGRYVIPETVQVFPGWAFLNGDLRPHMTGAPFLVLGIAVVAAAVWTLRTRRRRILFVGVLPALAGWTAVVNTWAFGVLVGVAGVAAAVTDAGPDVVGRRWPRPTAPPSVRAVLDGPIGGSVVAALVAGIGLAWVFPFVLFRSAQNRGIGLLPPDSPLGPFLLAYGAFLLVFAAFLRPSVREHLDALVARHDDRPVAMLIFGGIAVVVAVATTIGRLPALIAIALVVTAWWVAHRTDGPDMTLILIVSGAGLVAFTELAWVRVWPYDLMNVRWNTLYKISHSVWIVWGIAAGVAATEVWSRVRSEADLGRRATTVGLVAVVGIVLASTLAFPLVGGTAAAFDQPDRQTLDGLAYLETTNPDALAAIEWLDDRPGRPVIASAPGTTIYSWVNAPSSLTGLPTVLGWDHQKGYRGVDTYEERYDLVGQIFDGDDATRHALLDRFDVAYVYVGPNEREQYDLRLDGDDRLDVAFRQGEIVIYAVEPA